MARIRTIKPEFWKHEALSELPEATHMLAAALLNYADDYGWFNANPKLIQAECSPLREPSVSIPESLGRLQTMGYIRLGTGADGRRYGHIVEFEKHQRVAHPTKSKIVGISITWDDLGKPPEDFVSPPETFAPEQGTGNRERNAAADARDPRFREVGEKVLALCGDSPNLLNYGRVDSWLKAGADPELDIFPAVAAGVAKLGKAPNSLNYFDGHVADAVARRTRPMPEGRGQKRGGDRYGSIQDGIDEFSNRLNGFDAGSNHQGSHALLSAPERREEFG